MQPPVRQPLTDRPFPMRITAIETIRLGEFPNLIWVHVETDEGLVGLGEVFYGAGAVEAHIHEFIAPYLLGENPLLKIQIILVLLTLLMELLL